MEHLTQNPCILRDFQVIGQLLQQQNSCPLLISEAKKVNGDKVYDTLMKYLLSL